MTDLEILMAARKLLMDPKRWARSSLCSKDSDTGEPCYCALGAIGAAAGIQWEWKDYYRFSNGESAGYFVISDNFADTAAWDQWVRVSELLQPYAEAFFDEEERDELVLDIMPDPDSNDPEGLAPAVHFVNDALGYEKVMELFSVAIADLVEKQEQPVS